MSKWHERRQEIVEIKVTAEQLAWIYFAVRISRDSYGLFEPLAKQCKELMGEGFTDGSPASRTGGQGWDEKLYGLDVYLWIKNIFKAPETNEQKKLRKMKEDYGIIMDARRELGMAIAEMQKRMSRL